MSNKHAFYIHPKVIDDGLSEGICVVMTDLDYFRKEGAGSDWHLTPGLKVPEYLDEAAEASFMSETQHDVEAIRKDLLALGFVDDPAFNAFILSCDMGWEDMEVDE